MSDWFRRLAAHLAAVLVAFALAGTTVGATSHGYDEPAMARVDAHEVEAANAGATLIDHPWGTQPRLP